MNISQELQARKNRLLSPEITWVPHSPGGTHEACLISNGGEEPSTRLLVSYSTFEFLRRFLGESPVWWNDSHTFSELMDMLDQAIIEAKEKECCHNPECPEAGKCGGECVSNWDRERRENVRSSS